MLAAQKYTFMYFWATVCTMVHPMLSDRCLSCLSVTLVYYGQTVGQIKMKLGMQVGLGPGHNVLDGDPDPSPPKGAEPPIFGPCMLRPNGCIDKDATWTEVGLGPGDFVLDGDPPPIQKGGRTPVPNFRPISVLAKRLDASRCHLVWR